MECVLQERCDEQAAIDIGPQSFADACEYSGTVLRRRVPASHAGAMTPQDRDPGTVPREASRPASSRLLSGTDAERTRALFQANGRRAVREWPG